MIRRDSERQNPVWEECGAIPCSECGSAAEVAWESTGADQHHDTLDTKLKLMFIAVGHHQQAPRCLVSRPSLRITYRCKMEGEGLVPYDP